MLNIEKTEVLLMVLIPMIFVALIMPIIKKVAFHVDALDLPDKRKVHSKPMPRLGGLGIFLGFLLGYMIFGEHTAIMNSILIASFIIIITGVIDDIKPLSAKYKLVGQIVSSLIIVFYGGLLLKDINLFGLYIDFNVFSYLITIGFILGCINCMNLIDGLDGLAGGISSIFFLTIGIIAIYKGQFILATTLTFIMLGSSLGFLFHNFYPAKIFMGDSGSMFLGLMISVITLLGFKTVMMSAIIIPLCILVIPILDTSLAILRRKLKGESISTPDKSHIHHQLLRRNFSQRNTVLIIYLITFLFSGATVIWCLVNKNIGLIIYAVLTLVLIVFIFKTDVLFERKSRK